MTETKHHYPQLINEALEFLNVFPNLTYQEMETFFFQNYGLKDQMDPTKMKNSLRMGFFKFNDCEANLTY